jgi:hypothetical protein
MTGIDLVMRRRNQAGSRGYRYDVLMGGELLCTANDPEFTACRILAERGITGKARFWREGKTEHDIEMDITKASKKCIRESEKHGPRIVKWSPNDWARERKFGELDEAA